MEHGDSADVYIVPQTTPPQTVMPPVVQQSISYDQNDFASAYTYSHTAAAGMAATEQNPSVTTSSAGPSRAWIEEVVAENAVLRAEVERLTGARAQADAGAAVSGQQQGMNVQPGGDVKYVCCGGCNQWLLAPTNSVYGKRHFPLYAVC